MSKGRTDGFVLNEVHILHMQNFDLVSACSSDGQEDQERKNGILRLQSRDQKHTFLIL